jgi:DNA end-binding protein Ku
MPRSLWSGAISFGLVSIPVRLVVIVRDKSISFHMLSPDGACRLRRKLFCPDTGKEYDFKDTARGYEVAPDQYVIITDDELKQIKPEKGDTLDIEDFVDLSTVDPIYFGKSYCLLPGKGGSKPYKLLVDALSHTGRAAIAHFTMRDKQHLTIIRPLDDALVLHTLHFADEVSMPAEFKDQLPQKVKVSPNERKTAEQLINTLAKDFDPAHYKDEYRDRLSRLLEAKAEGERIEVAQEPEETPRTYSLINALKQSLESAKRKPAASRSNSRHASNNRKSPHRGNGKSKPMANGSTRRKKAA